MQSRFSDTFGPAKTVTKFYVTKSKLHFTTLVVRLGGFFQNDEENTKIQSYITFVFT